MSESSSEREPIAPEEPLYRGLKEDWVLGPMVLPAAIDLPDTSVYRDHYLAEPDQVLRILGPDYVSVAQLTSADLPAESSNRDQQTKAGQEPVVWRWDVVDDPVDDPLDEGRVAHAEIRLRRTTDSLDMKPSKRRPGSQSFKMTLREQLAAVMRLL